jgi:hypothetical protein
MSESEREKDGEYQVIGQGRIYITTLFLSLVRSTFTFIIRPRGKERKEKKERNRERERVRFREEYIHLQSTIYT